MFHCVKSLIVVAIVGFVAVSARASTSDFVWTDEARAKMLLAHTGYAHVYVYFCGVCPRASRMLRTQVKAIHDLIEDQQLGALLVIVTPDHSPDQLVRV